MVKEKIVAGNKLGRRKGDGEGLVEKKGPCFEQYRYNELSPFSLLKVLKQT